MRLIAVVAGLAMIVASVMWIDDGAFAVLVHLAGVVLFFAAVCTTVVEVGNGQDD